MKDEDRSPQPCNNDRDWNHYCEYWCDTVNNTWYLTGENHQAGYYCVPPGSCTNESGAHCTEPEWVSWDGDLNEPLPENTACYRYVYERESGRDGRFYLVRSRLAEGFKAPGELVSPNGPIAVDVATIRRYDPPLGAKIQALVNDPLIERPGENQRRRLFSLTITLPAIPIEDDPEAGTM